MADMNVPSYAGLSGQKLQFAITSTATIGFLLFGYDQGVMSGIVCPCLFVCLFVCPLGG